VVFSTGRRAVPVPPLWHPDRIPGWWHEYGPVVAAFGVLRAVLLMTSCYLTALWTAALVSWSLPHPGVVGFLLRARLPGARTVARSVLGITAAGAVWAGGIEASFAAGNSPDGPTAGAPIGGQSPAPVLRYLGPATASAPTPTPDLVGPGSRRPPLPPAHAFSLSPQTSATSGTSRPTAPRSSASVPARSAVGRLSPASGIHSAPPASSPAPVVKTRQGQVPATGTPLGRGPATGAWDPGDAPTGRATNTPATPAEPDAGEVLGSSGGTHRAGSWIVRPGDNLWTIAETALAAAWERPPDLSDLGAYWWQVVQLNRPRLPRPSDPDLLFPGDEVSLPTPPSGPPPG
jgi:hypothetical protein